MSGIELDELSGGILVAQKWLTSPHDDERERVLGELMALIDRSETPAGWVQVTRPFSPRYDVTDFLLGDDCAVQSLQECLRGIPGAALVEGCVDCFAVAREVADSSSAECSSTLAVLRNASAMEHVCSYTAGALWRATGSLWIESLTIAVGRTFTVATLVVLNHYLVEAAYSMVLDETAPSRYLAVSVMGLCVTKTALLRWLFPLLISPASLLVECAIASILVHHRFEEELRERLQVHRTLWRSRRVRRAFLRLRAASLILPRWLPRLAAGRVRTAVPARPREVSMIEGEVVARETTGAICSCAL